MAFLTLVHIPQTYSLVSFDNYHLQIYMICLVVLTEIIPTAAIFECLKNTGDPVMSEKARARIIEVNHEH